MKRLRKLSDKGVVEVTEDIIINILYCLPSKSLARFKCVSKHWLKFIADSSLSYSCRSRRWRPQPNLIGFFYQARDTYERLKIRFFFSSKESSLVIDGSLDESVNSLGRKRVYIVSSSNGFLLCIDLTGVYYVYNPATRQRLALPKPRVETNDPTVGFICKVDDSDKDVISFTVVRHWDYLSSVTVECFSSETNVWTVNNLNVDARPLRRWNYKTLKSPSAGVIDGVFCWLYYFQQITAYGSVHKRFCGLELPHDQHMVFTDHCFLGFSGGAFYYALNVGTTITVWRLESNIRSRDAVWVRKYAANFASTVLQCLEAFRLIDSPPIEVQNMDIHPAIPHIFYLNVRGKVISYDLETNIAELVYDFGEYCWRTEYYKLFAYEWHQWPRLL
ncbi:PREDICTED: F-box protein At5g03970-like [Nicotiana attenuata]|uniref:F-box protein n=1 Tax=Nicotiana attenuata TaxID=49451 RepID=A0A1J6JD28_NICAT|nr:PREDICTED: F-box protein At5g03970-like [Nicotiana attenuata]OIT07591.1 f-box protein [Nicotiana attenuata]